MESPFSRYPAGGRTLLGRPPGDSASCRLGYGLGLQRVTGQTVCAYCGVSLVDDYYHWLLMSVDHVVPRGEGLRLGIETLLTEDMINLVLCCAGCNGFGNRYRVQAALRPIWLLTDFLALRDQIFAERFERIAARRRAEQEQFVASPWQVRDAPG